MFWSTESSCCHRWLVCCHMRTNCLEYYLCEAKINAVLWHMEWLYSELKKKINSLVTPNAMVITWLINGITHFHGMHFWAIVQGNTVGCNDWINRWCKVRHNWTNVIFRILSVVEFIPYCCWQIKVGLFLCMCINRNW